MTSSGFVQADDVNDVRTSYKVSVGRYLCGGERATIGYCMLPCFSTGPLLRLPLTPTVILIISICQDRRFSLHNKS